MRSVCAQRRPVEHHGLLRALVAAAAVLTAAGAFAQARPGAGTPQHIICDSGCGGGAAGGGAVTVADAADVAQGATTDVAVQGDTAGTISAKLRGLNKSIAAGLAVTGTFWQTTQPVSFTMPALVAGSAVIGHVIVDTAPTTAVTGTFWQVTQPVSIASMPSTPVTGTFFQTTQPVSAAALPLPANAASETGGNLAAIKTDVDKIPSQGQAVASASMPVVLPAAQITTLTPLSSVTVTQATGTNLHVVVDTAPTTAVTGTFWPATQPVSATALPLPANATQETGGNLATLVTQTKSRGAASPATMVLATNVDTTLLAANAARVTWRVCNQSRSPLLVKFGTGATEFSYNVRVAPRACYEDSSYSGVVDGVWFIGADNYAMVSESS